MKTKECNKKIKRMFPEHQDLIHKLRHDDPHFAKIFESHQELDKEIIQLINDDIESMKRKKLKMKDEIYKILTKNAQAGDFS